MDQYTLNILINCYCLVGRVDLGFSLLAGFFKRGFVPSAGVRLPGTGIVQEDKIQKTL